MSVPRELRSALGADERPQAPPSCNSPLAVRDMGTAPVPPAQVYLVGDEQWGGCETCGDAIAVKGRTPPLTRWYRPVRRDGQSVTVLVRLCADCSDIIRH